MGGWVEGQPPHSVFLSSPILIIHTSCFIACLRWHVFGNNYGANVEELVHSEIWRTLELIWLILLQEHGAEGKRGSYRMWHLL